MVISIYKADRDWTFEKMKGTSPIRIQVPAGSELLQTKLFGLELFVPTRKDPRVRMGWTPNLVLAESSRPAGRFKVVNAPRAMTAR